MNFNIKKIVTKLIILAIVIVAPCYAQKNRSLLTQTGQTINDQILWWLVRYAGEGPDIIEQLINIIVTGVNVNIVDDEGRTPLMLAASQNHLKKANLLLASLADPNMLTKNGETALFIATKKNHLDMVQMLLDAHADPNLDSQNTAIGGNTPLMVAVENMYPSIVERLLAYGANPNTKTSSSVTPLLLAAYNGTPLIMEALIAAGADINATDEFGMTPIMWAIIKKHITPIEILLKARANLYIVSNNGKNALDLMVEKLYNITLIKKLKKGATK